MDTQELVVILRKALENAIVPDVPLGQLPSWIALNMATQVGINPTHREELKGFLAADHALTEVLSSRIHAGTHSVESRVDILATWLVSRAKEIDPESAVSDLNRFLEAKFLPGQEVLVISGLRLAHEFHLGRGITLVPFHLLEATSSRNSFLLDQQGSKVSRHPDGTPILSAMESTLTWSEIHLDSHLPTAALKIRHEFAPKLNPSDAQRETTLKRDELEEICLLLSLVRSSAIFRLAYWCQMEEWIPCVGGAGSYNTYWQYRTCAPSHALDVRDEEAMSALVKDYFNLTDRVRERLQISIHRFNAALAFVSIEDAAIDLGIALEALLLGDLQPNDQISLAFRLRGAWLVGTTTSERADARDVLNQIYSLRSQAAHGKKISASIRFRNEEVSAGDFLMNHGLPLCARGIRLVIARGGVPDWNSLLIGAL